MKIYRQIITVSILVSCLVLSACGAKQTQAAIPTLPTLPLPSPAPTETATPPPTSTATNSPTPVSTVIGGNNSFIIYEDSGSNYQTLRMKMPNTNSGILVSQLDLKRLMPKDRYTESVFGETGWRRWELFTLSPDGKNILTNVCTTLDANRRCIYQYYVVRTDLSATTQLEVPGASSVSWRWSPDGKKLTGLASAYLQYTFEEPIAYYAINSDGTGLTRIGEVPLNVYDMAWSSDSRTVYPISLATHFKAMPVDGSGEQKIEIEGLEVDDQITCLQFTPDHQKVAFMVTRAFPKGHYRIYTANADFSHPTLTTEFDTDHAVCQKFDWSPNQDHILVEFSGIPTAGGGFIGDDLQFIFDVNTGTEITTLPTNEDICGWAPDGQLVYWDGNIKLTNLSDPDQSKNLKLSDCPILWLPQDLVPSELKNISLRTSICQPGESIEARPDDSTPAYLDLIEARTELDGEILTTTFTFRDIPGNVAINQRSHADIPRTGNGRPEITWMIKIDIDNNITTGFKGNDIQVEVSDYLLDSSVNNASPQTLNLTAWVVEPNADVFNPSNIEEATIAVDKVSDTVTVSAYIKGITASSGLIFEISTYLASEDYYSIKRLCD